MKKKQEPKHTRDKLNQHQREALQLAENGSYLKLIDCCLDCTKALEKCWKAIELGIPGWGERTAEHYLEIRGYLETFIDDDFAWKQYRKAIKEMENKNGK